MSQKLEQFTVQADTRDILEGDHTIGTLTIEAAPFYPFCLPPAENSPEKFRELAVQAKHDFPGRYINVGDCYWISSCLTNRGSLRIEHLNLGDLSTIDVAKAADGKGGNLHIEDEAELDIRNSETTLRAQNSISYPETMLAPSSVRMVEKYSDDLQWNDAVTDVTLTATARERLGVANQQRMLKENNYFDTKFTPEAALKHCWGTLSDHYNIPNIGSVKFPDRHVNIVSPHVKERYNHPDHSAGDMRDDPALWQASWAHPKAYYNAKDLWLNYDSAQLKDYRGGVKILRNSSISLGLADQNKCFSGYDFVSIDRMHLGKDMQVQGGDLNIRSLRVDGNLGSTDSSIAAAHSIKIGSYLSHGAALNIRQLTDSNYTQDSSGLEVTVGNIQKESLECTRKDPSTPEQRPRFVDDHGGKIHVSGKNVSVTIENAELPYEIDKEEGTYLKVFINHPFMQSVHIEADEIHLKSSPELYRGNRSITLNGKVFLNDEIKYPDGRSIDNREIGGRHSP